MTNLQSVEAIIGFRHLPYLYAPFSSHLEIPQGVLPRIAYIGGPG